MSLSPPHPGVQSGEWFSIDNASWDLYEFLLRDVDRQNVRITYDQGRLVLMSPLPIHEKVKKLTAMLIEMAAVEKSIPFACLGSTTWKRPDKGKGLEADECYYIQHEAEVRFKTEFDLRHDPAPDLAVEVDITHHPLDRPSIYAALGVNELWRYDGERMVFLKLGTDRRYQPIGVSEALSFLTPEAINRFLGLVGTTGDMQLMQLFREWLRTLPPSE